MNTIIAKALKTLLLDSQSWKQITAGLVKDFEKVIAVPARDGAKPFTSKRKFPVSCEYTSDECQQGKYQQLVPDTKKRCIMYFEDLGTTPDGNVIGTAFPMVSGLRLVCWANMNHFDVNNACSISGRMIVEILNKIPVNPFNAENINTIKVTTARIVPKSAAIFSRYTYDEPIMQYLLYPYDYFAIDLKVSYQIEPSCFDELQIKEPEC